MANNTYITEAFKALNKMPRMHDSKKSLKESQNRDRDDYKSYIINSLKDSGYSNFARVYSGYDFYESNGHNVVIDDTAKEIEIPDSMPIERIVKELTSKSRANSYKESSRKGLTESEMSPEDEADTEVLRNIQDKMKRRPSSARLNRKELAVLDKYGLSYDKDSAVLRYSESGAPFYGIWNGRTKANLADSARKQQDRQLARRVTDDSVFNARNRYHNMEIALDHRNWARQELDRLDDKNRPSYAPNEFNYYQGPQTADSLAKDIDMIKSGREFDRNHAQAQVDRSQKEINKLLRRDESLTESSHTYNGFTVEDEDSHYVIRDFTGNIQSQADTPEEAHQIIDSELGTRQVIVNVNKFSDLDSYCKKFNLSIVNQERAPYMEYTLQGDLNNINTLIDYINQYK